MKTADFYQGTADAMGVALYLYPDGSVTNSRKAGVEPTAMIRPHDHWKPANDHGLSFSCPIGPPLRDRKFADSLLEESGFELLVPLQC